MRQLTQTEKAFAIFGVIVLVLLILAAYGWYTGAWWEEIPVSPTVPPPPAT